MKSDVNALRANDRIDLLKMLLLLSLQLEQHKNVISKRQFIQPVSLVNVLRANNCVTTFAVTAAATAARNNSSHMTKDI